MKIVLLFLIFLNTKYIKCEEYKKAKKHGKQRVFVVEKGNIYSETKLQNPDGIKRKSEFLYLLDPDQTKLEVSIGKDSRAEKKEEIKEELYVREESLITLPAIEINGEKKDPSLKFSKRGLPIRLLNKPFSENLDKF